MLCVIKSSASGIWQLKTFWVVLSMNYDHYESPLYVKEQKHTILHAETIISITILPAAWGCPPISLRGHENSTPAPCWNTDTRCDPPPWERKKKHHHTTVEVEISLNVEKMHPFQFFGWKKLTSWNYNLDQNWLLVPIAPNVVFMTGQVSEHMWTWIFQPHPSRFLLRSRIIDTLDSIRLPDDVQNNRYLESINLPGEGQLSYRVLVGQS